MTASTELLAIFRERLIEIHGAVTANAVWQSMHRPKRQAYWLNPLVERPGAFEPLGDPVPGLDDVFSVGPEERETVTRHEGAQAGWLYPLNPSSLLAVAVLAPQPGEEDPRPGRGAGWQDRSDRGADAQLRPHRGRRGGQRAFSTVCVPI